VEIAAEVRETVDSLAGSRHSGSSELGSTDEKLQDWLASVAPALVPPKKRRRTMTWKKLKQHIQLGYGMGHGAAYQPWLTLRRKNASKCSNQVAAYLFTLARPGYFFSRGEYQIALLLQWLGLEDFREQYPIWPISHPHPLFGAPGAEGIHLGHSPGLLRIAQEAGIEHGVYPGTRIPYVATFDFMLTVRIHGALTLIALSCKPIDNPNNEIEWRTLERLELERRYAERNRIKYAVISSRLVPIRMAANLEWCVDSATLVETPHLIAIAPLFAAQFVSTPDLSIADAVLRSSDACKLSRHDGWTVFRHCLWTQAIDLDISKPILTTYPALIGGRRLRQQLKQALIGGGSA